jgi:hypothetical protein
MTKAILIAVTTGALLAVSTARAQEAPAGVRCMNCPPPAPSSAIDLGLGLGWQRGTGGISSAPGDSVQNYAGSGASAAVELGFRLRDPHWMFGIYGQGTEYRSSDLLLSTTDVRDLTAGIQAAVHISPYSSIDPWASFGTGYHGFWVVPAVGPNTSRQGLEIARARLGVDFRLNRYVAVGPVGGADMSLFLSEKLPGDEEYHSVDGEKLNFFFFAGFQTRMNFGGTSYRPSGTATR